MKLRIATRESPLALWQAHHVQARLRQHHPDATVELVPMTTSGDRWLETPLATVGGKGLFVKELEDALLAGRADLAVHSMKDVPAALPEGLALVAYLSAEDPRDALVSRAGTLDALPRGARVGTSSLRRQVQLRHLRPDLKIEPLRGNVGTRLSKLDEGRYDAIVLACAGLKRLGLAARITQTLEPAQFLPAVGQGVIGIECRAGDAATRAALAPLHDAASATRLAAERAFNSTLGAACQAPVAGHAVIRDEKGVRGEGQRLTLDGLVGTPDGARVIRDRIEGSATEAATLGASLAARMLNAGAAEILRQVMP